MCLLAAGVAHRGAAAKKARNERREALSSISIVGRPYHKNGVIGGADTLRDGGVDRARSALEEALVLRGGLDGGEEEIARADTSGRLGRKPTCTWMMRIPEAR